MTEKEYNHCVRKHSDELYQFALRYSNLSAAAEDAVQEAYVALWEHRAEVKAEGGKGFLVRVLYRTLVSMHRHDEVVRQAAVEADESYRQHAAFELKDALSQALAQLPEQWRALVLLHDLQGYDYAEMAQMSGLSENQVGVYLFRARKKLKELLEPYRP